MYGVGRRRRERLIENQHKGGGAGVPLWMPLNENEEQGASYIPIDGTEVCSIFVNPKKVNKNNPPLKSLKKNQQAKRNQNIFLCGMLSATL